MPLVIAQASQVLQFRIVLPPLEVVPLGDAQASQVSQSPIVLPPLVTMPFMAAQASQFMPKPKANRLDGVPLGILIVAQ